MTQKEKVLELLRMVYLTLKLRSISRAKWVIAYENFKTKDGK